LDHAVLLLALLFGSSAELRRKPFAIWLLGSNQIEHMLSEWRAFEQGNTTWTLLSVLNIAKRWLFQSRMLAALNVHLPPLVSNRGHSRSRYCPEDRSPHIHDDYPTAAELLQMYAAVVVFVQEVLAALGMANTLFDAGLWDEPPLEEWAHVRAAAAAEAERAAAHDDAAQFDGQAEEHEAGQEAAVLAAAQVATAAAADKRHGSRASGMPSTRSWHTPTRGAGSPSKHSIRKAMWWEASR
jgi:hypothetical protein